MLQRIAAVAAPLNICEVFPTLALLLFTIAAWRRQIKRAVLTLAVGVLCWSMLNTFYIKGQAKNTERRQLNLQGDSLTDEQFAEVIMLIGWTLICMVLAPILLICCCAGMILVLIKGTAVLSGLATAVAFFIVIFMSRNLLEDSTRKVGGVVTVKSQPFFIPRTDTSIQSLDQVVALCGGCVTLLFSLIEAFQARRKSRAAENNQQANSVQAAGGCNGLGWEEEVSVQVLLHRRRSV
jgi:hypothetical protein